MAKTKAPKPRFKAGDRVMITRDVDFPQNVGAQLLIVGPTDPTAGYFVIPGQRLGEWECRPLSKVWSWCGIDQADLTDDDVACFDADLVKVA